MINISALHYCFLIFPQFRIDYDYLIKIKAFEHINDDHCKWLLEDLCLLEYFSNIGAIAIDAYDTSSSEWMPIEKLFGLKIGSLEVIGRNNNPDNLSKDYKKLITRLNKHRNRNIKIPKMATDLTCFKYFLSNPRKLLIDFNNNFFNNNGKIGGDLNSNKILEFNNEIKSTIEDYIIV